MRRPDSGVILVNVLVALALGATLVSLMLTSQDTAIDRARRANAAAQAEALALGAETSVLVALRRDMIEAPEIDHYAEPWAVAATQEEIVLETGRFSVEVRDVQAGFDVNALAGAAPGPVAAFSRLLGELDLPADVAGPVLSAVQRDGPLAGLGQIAGLDAATRAALEPHLSFLPVPAPVNLNTATPAVIAAVLPDRSAAIRLVSLRARKGYVEAQDLRDLGIVGGAMIGLQSDTWDVRTRADVDGTTIELGSRLQRVRAPGRVGVIVVSRKFGPPEGAPDIGPADQ